VGSRIPIPHRHRLDEFPAGYSSADCSPAEPASAFPVDNILLDLGRKALEDYIERGSEFIARVSPEGFTPGSAFIGVYRRPSFFVTGRNLQKSLWPRMNADERRSNCLVISQTLRWKARTAWTSIPTASSKGDGSHRKRPTRLKPHVPGCRWMSGCLLDNTLRTRCEIIYPTTP